MKRNIFCTMFLIVYFALFALTGCAPKQGENEDAEGAPVSIDDIIQSLTEDGLADDVPDEQTQNYAPEDADTPNDPAPGEETVPVENLSLYIPVVEDVINADNERVYMQNGDAPGMLFDLDQDGVRELIMLYTAELDREVGDTFPSYVCSVYSVRDNDLWVGLDKLQLEQLAAAPHAQVDLVELNGTIFLMTSHGNNESENHWDYYTLYDAVTMDACTEYLCSFYYEVYNDEEHGWMTADEPDIHCEKDGVECSYDEYLAFLDALTYIDEMMVSERFEYGENGMPLTELIAYLKTDRAKNISDNSNQEVLINSEIEEKSNINESIITRYIIDECGVLSDNDLTILNIQAEEIFQKHGIEILFLLTENTSEMDITDYADACYDELADTQDGLLFVVDDTSGAWHIMCSGRAGNLFTENDLYEMFDAYINNTTYAGGVEAYLELSESILTERHTGHSR